MYEFKGAKFLFVFVLAAGTSVKIILFNLSGLNACLARGGAQDLK